MDTLIYVVVIVLVTGVLAWLIQQAPFIAEPFKSIGVWCLIAVAVILVLIKVVGLTGVDF